MFDSHYKQDGQLSLNQKDLDQGGQLNNQCLTTDPNYSQQNYVPTSPTASSPIHYFLRNSEALTECPLIVQQLYQFGNNFDQIKEFTTNEQNDKQEQERISNTRINQEKQPNTYSISYQGSSQINQHYENKDQVNTIVLIQDKVYKLSSLSLCRIYQLIVLLGYYIYSLIWFLYASGDISNNESSSTSTKVKVVDRDDQQEVCLVYSHLLLSTFIILIQFITHVNVIALMRNNKIYNNQHIFTLKLCLFTFQLLEFALFMIYSWPIDNTFKMIGILTFIQVFTVQSYYNYSYQNLLSLVKQCQVNYLINPLTLQPLTID